MEKFDEKFINCRSDECGIYDLDMSNDCVQDCTGAWGGNASDVDGDGLENSIDWDDDNDGLSDLYDPDDGNCGVVDFDQNDGFYTP